MPLTAKGSEIMENMKETYGSEKKAKEVFYASKNKGTIEGVDAMPPLTGTRLPSASTPIAPAPGATQQFGRNPPGLTPPAGGTGGSKAIFTRGGDTQVATARDMARLAGAKR